MKDEGAAYLMALNLKDQFYQKATLADLAPANLDGAVTRMEQTKEKMENCCEKLSDENLIKEVFTHRKEIQGYLLVLKNLKALQAEDPAAWEALKYFLDPEVELAALQLEAERVARRTMARLGGFSQTAKKLLDETVKKREAFEAQKFQQRRKPQPAPKTSGGFLGKLGIKF